MGSSDVFPTCRVSVQNTCTYIISNETYRGNVIRDSDRSILGTQEVRKEKAVRILGSSCLLQEPSQDGSVLGIEEVATPGD